MTTCTIVDEVCVSSILGIIVTNVIVMLEDCVCLLPLLPHCIPVHQGIINSRAELESQQLTPPDGVSEIK